MYVGVWVACIYVHHMCLVPVEVKPEEGVRFPGTAGTDGCEQYHENQTRVLFKTNKCSELLNRVSSLNMYFLPDNGNNLKFCGTALDCLQHFCVCVLYV